MLDLKTAVVFNPGTAEEQIGYIEEAYIEDGDLAYTVELEDGTMVESVRRAQFVLFNDA